MDVQEFVNKLTAELKRRNHHSYSFKVEADNDMQWVIVRRFYDTMKGKAESGGFAISYLVIKDDVWCKHFFDGKTHLL